MIFSDFCFCIYCSIFDILHFHSYIFYYVSDILHSYVAIKLTRVVRILLLFTSMDFCDFLWLLFLYLLFYIWYFTFLLQHKCRDKINNSPWNVTFIYFSGFLWFLPDFRLYISYLVSNILHFYYNTDIAIKLIKAIDILLSFTSVDFNDFFWLPFLHKLFYIWYFILFSFLLHDVRSPMIYVLQEVVGSKLNSLHVQRWIGNLDWNCFT